MAMGDFAAGFEGPARMGLQLLRDQQGRRHEAEMARDNRRHDMMQFNRRMAQLDEQFNRTQTEVETAGAHARGLAEKELASVVGVNDSIVRANNAQAAGITAETDRLNDRHGLQMRKDEYAHGRTVREDFRRDTAQLNRRVQLGLAAHGGDVESFANSSEWQAVQEGLAAHPAAAQWIRSRNGNAHPTDPDVRIRRLPGEDGAPAEFVVTFRNPQGERVVMTKHGKKLGENPDDPVVPFTASELFTAFKGVVARNVDVQDDPYAGAEYLRSGAAAVASATGEVDVAAMEALNSIHKTFDSDVRNMAGDTRFLTTGEHSTAVDDQARIADTRRAQQLDSATHPDIVRGAVAYAGEQADAAVSSRANAAGRTAQATAEQQHEYLQSSRFENAVDDIVTNRFAMGGIDEPGAIIPSDFETYALRAGMSPDDQANIVASDIRQTLPRAMTFLNMHPDLKAELGIPPEITHLHQLDRTHLQTLADVVFESRRDDVVPKWWSYGKGRDTRGQITPTGLREGLKSVRRFQRTLRPDLSGPGKQLNAAQRVLDDFLGGALSR